MGVWAGEWTCVWVCGLVRGWVTMGGWAGVVLNKIHCFHVRFQGCAWLYVRICDICTP